MKRRIVHAALCLILGVVTTVGVAWGLAWFDSDVHESQSYERALERVGPGAEHLGIKTCTTLGSQGAVVIRADFADAETTDAGSVERLMPEWIPEATVGESIELHAFQAHGWPVLSSWCESLLLRPNASVRDLGGVAIRRDDPACILPLRPIFPGFIVNTLFYAAIWFGVLFVPGIAKRAIRRKRGRCVKCGYDLRGDVAAGCPECGWGREDADR